MLATDYWKKVGLGKNITSVIITGQKNDTAALLRNFDFDSVFVFKLNFRKCV
jgi:hypothetical protein